MGIWLEGGVLFLTCVHLYKCTPVQLYKRTSVHLYKFDMADFRGWRDWYTCTYEHVYTCTPVHMYKRTLVHVQVYKCTPVQVRERQGSRTVRQLNPSGPCQALPGRRYKEGRRRM